MRPSKLKRAYLRYNRLYFGNLLPTDIDLKWQKFGGDSLYGCWVEGYISINAKHKKLPKVWKMTLLHEMAHAATDTERSEHGPRWRKEMRRLARLGAFDRLW